MAPSKPPPPAPLPVAPDHAVLSNRLNLLLAKQSTLRSSLNKHKPKPSSSASSTTAGTAPQATSQRRINAAVNDDGDDDDDNGRLVAGANPNAGAGYVPDKKAAGPVVSGNSKADRLLRGRLQGRQGAAAGGQRRAARAESESDEDEGRTALGKRKRPRREAQPGEETSAVLDGEKGESQDDIGDEPQRQPAKEEEQQGSGGSNADPGERMVVDTPMAQGRKNKKKKNKSKGKNKGGQLES
ncbi:hypothetical protein VFPBJ_05931 [Purpureocillium lilacinum]|uniref:Uncharacterized protein n=1 Tax=Purpureocillium lilacinum TaxID=33203 RepID=A0A179GQX3_PURLI|nr:hypothetical protein VFPBJ_05931 [Purpureocillium lilacinum]